MLARHTGGGGLRAIMSMEAAMTSFLNPLPRWEESEASHEWM